MEEEFLIIKILAQSLTFLILASFEMKLNIRISMLKMKIISTLYCSRPSSININSVIQQISIAIVFAENFHESLGFLSTFYLSCELKYSYFSPRNQLTAYNRENSSRV